jgi:hypothetical protein
MGLSFLDEAPTVKQNFEVLSPFLPKEWDRLAR